MWRREELRCRFALGASFKACRIPQRHGTSEESTAGAGWLDSGRTGVLRCRAERRGVSRCCGYTNRVWGWTQRGVGTLRLLPVLPLTRLHPRSVPLPPPPPPPPSPPPPGAPCGVSAVYGDRRRHLPSSLALPLCSASLGYERRDFLPDEDARLRQQRRGFLPVVYPFALADLSLMYRNKLVRCAHFISRETCSADGEYSGELVTPT